MRGGQNQYCIVLLQSTSTTKIKDDDDDDRSKFEEYIVLQRKNSITSSDRQCSGCSCCCNGASSSSSNAQRKRQQGSTGDIYIYRGRGARSTTQAHARDIRSVEQLWKVMTAHIDNIILEYKGGDPLKEVIHYIDSKLEDAGIMALQKRWIRTQVDEARCHSGGEYFLQMISQSVSSLTTTMHLVRRDDDAKTHNFYKLLIHPSTPALCRCNSHAFQRRHGTIHQILLWRVYYLNHQQSQCHYG